MFKNFFAYVNEPNKSRYRKIMLAVIFIASLDVLVYLTLGDWGRWEILTPAGALFFYLLTYYVLRDEKQPEPISEEEEEIFELVEEMEDAANEEEEEGEEEDNEEEEELVDILEPGGVVI